MCQFSVSIRIILLKLNNNHGGCLDQHIFSESSLLIIILFRITGSWWKEADFCLLFSCIVFKLAVNSAPWCCRAHSCAVLCSAAQLCPTLCDPMDVARQAPLSRGISRQEYWSGCHALLLGIFPTQGSNPGLLRCSWILYQLSCQGSPQLISVSLLFHWILPSHVHLKPEALESHSKIPSVFFFSLEFILLFFFKLFHYMVNSLIEIFFFLT